MYKFCSDCEKLDTKSGSNGVYKCKVTKSSVLANQVACPKFSKSYARDNFQSQKLCDEAKNYEKTHYSGSVGGSLFLLILLVLVLIIVKIVEYVG